MDDIVVEDLKFDEIVHVDTNPYTLDVDQSRRVKSSGRHKGLVCHGATILYVFVTITNSIHWIPPYPNLPYVDINDSDT